MSISDQHDNESKQDMDAVSRAYRADRESDGMAPPAALDDAIRAAAHRAVHAGPKLAGSSWLRRWTPQLAVAAVVVLSVSVVFVSVEERPELAPEPVQKIALNREPAIPPEAPPPPTRNVEPAAKAKMAADAVKKQESAETGAIVADAHVAQKKFDALRKQESRAPALQSPPPPQMSANVAPSAPPVYAPPKPPALAPPPAPAAARPAPTPFPGTAAESVAPARKEARADERFAAAPEPKPLEEKVTVAGAVRSRDSFDAPAKTAASLAPAPPTVSAAATPAAPAAAVPAPMIKPLAPAPSASAAGAISSTIAPLHDSARLNAQGTKAAAAEGSRAYSKDDYKLAGKLEEDQRPGPWLKRLLELREQNKLKELREELVRFKKAHPDVVLPKILKELPAE